MTQLFISHSHADLACVEQIRADLEAAGYAVWKDTQSILPGSPSYVRALEAGVRGSAGLIVTWSVAAAASEWVERELLYAQRLLKPIYPVQLDETPPGMLLVATQYIHCPPPCTEAVRQLLPALPPLDADGELAQAAQLLAHPYIRDQQEGIRRAEALLGQGRYREQLLAMLEDAARGALYDAVREEARRVLEDERQKTAPVLSADQARHIFSVRCPHGHITHFDRRQVCGSSGYVRRLARRGGHALDDVLLKCGTCHEEMSVPVDCEGYR